MKFINDNGVLVLQEETKRSLNAKQVTKGVALLGAVSLIAYLLLTIDPTQWVFWWYEGLEWALGKNYFLHPFEMMSQRSAI